MLVKKNMNTSKKRPLTLIILLVIGIIVYFGFTNWQELFMRSKNLFTIEKPTQVFIVDANLKTEANHVKDAWTSSGFPADNKKIDTLLETVKKFTNSNVVSKNKDRFKEYGIRPDKYIQINDNKIYVGDRNGSLGSYIRINEEPILYSVETDLSEYFYPVDLRNLIPDVVASEKNVTGLTIENNTTNLSFLKDNGQWVVNNQKANREKVDFLINDIKTLNTTDIQEIEAVDNSTMSAMMNISLREDKKTKNVLFYSPNESVVYMQIENGKYVYTLDPSSLLPFQKAEEDFIDIE
jgi:hypothetical protein